VSRPGGRRPRGAAARAGRRGRRPGPPWRVRQASARRCSRPSARPAVQRVSAGGVRAWHVGRPRRSIPVNPSRTSRHPGGHPLALPGGRRSPLRGESVPARPVDCPPRVGHPRPARQRRRRVGRARWAARPRSDRRGGGVAGPPSGDRTAGRQPFSGEMRRL